MAIAIRLLGTIVILLGAGFLVLLILAGPDWVVRWLFGIRPPID